jgi:hypothetical protein
MHRRTLSKDGVYYFLFSPSTVTILYLLSRILVWLGPFFSLVEDEGRLVDDR